MELFLEFYFRLFSLAVRDTVSFRRMRFLINQLLKNNHLQSALPDGGFLFLGKSVVLAGVREDLQHFSRSRSRSVKAAPFTRATGLSLT